MNSKYKIAIEYEDEIEELEKKIATYDKVLVYISNGHLNREHKIYREFYRAFVEIDKVASIIGSSEEEYRAAQERFNNIEEVCMNLEKK